MMASENPGSVDRDPETATRGWTKTFPRAAFGPAVDYNPVCVEANRSLLFHVSLIPDFRPLFQHATTCCHYRRGLCDPDGQRG